MAWCMCRYEIGVNINDPVEPCTGHENGACQEKKLSDSKKKEGLRTRCAQCSLQVGESSCSLSLMITMTATQRPRAPRVCRSPSKRREQIRTNNAPLSPRN